MRVQVAVSTGCISTFLKQFLLYFAFFFQNFPTTKLKFYLDLKNCCLWHSPHQHEPTNLVQPFLFLRRVGIHIHFTLSESAHAQWFCLLPSHLLDPYFGCVSIGLIHHLLIYPKFQEVAFKCFSFKMNLKCLLEKTYSHLLQGHLKPFKPILVAIRNRRKKPLV